MPGSSYDRYGLTSNPFRDLSSESLDDVEIYHVNLDVDRVLATIRDEIFEKENRAFVALVGLHGAGKTERLLVAQSEAKERNAFCIYFDITTKTSWVVKGLADAIKKGSKVGGFAQIFGGPKWFRDVASLPKLKEKNYDPVKVGMALAGALNANAPALLLLNDLHNLAGSDELSLFARTLQEMVDQIKPGVLVMFGAFPSFMVQLATDQAPLSSRINRTLVLPRLTAEEASLLIAKKLLAKRLVEGLDPLYPFDPESVRWINQMAYGNPRRLLELADACIEYAVAHRSYRIDTEIVRSAMMERQVQDIKSLVDARSTPWEESSAHDDESPPTPPGAIPATTTGRSAPAATVGGRVA